MSKPMDLLERLRAAGDRNEGRPYSDMHEAADAIERLRAALKPFAEAADNYEKPHELLPAAPDAAKIEVGDLTVADLRRARDALAHEQSARREGERP